MGGLGNAGFLGAIEVFSKEAMKKFLGVDSGEDGFFKGCMDGIGVGFIWDQNMFKPNFDPAICTNGMYAAYHPIKYPSHWQRCWDIATGKMCQGLTYDCGGALDTNAHPRKISCKTGPTCGQCSRDVRARAID